MPGLLSPATPSRVARDADSAPLVIGLVNNMPDAALRTTERQFSELIAAAAGPLPFELRLYALPDVPRSETARAHVKEHYEDAGALQDQQHGQPIDGLIVTGTEPRSRNLSDEPYWASLARLVDWAAENTASTIWSCLAAHAAVLHLDGIERQGFGDKLSGLFDCEKATRHALTAGTPALWHVPHSRYNDLPRDALIAKDYRILSQSSDAGVDMFLKQKNSLFVFFQGHPEYDAAALLREYRTDVLRFLNGKRSTYPSMPRNYFDAELASKLSAFRSRTEAEQTNAIFTDFPIDEAEGKPIHDWRPPAVRIYANWLSCLADRAARRRGRSAGLLVGE
jgi:homoserine O-succinyltransferase/O-acetyltransferase